MLGQGVALGLGRNGLHFLRQNKMNIPMKIELKQDFVVG